MAKVRDLSLPSFTFLPDDLSQWDGQRLKDALNALQSHMLDVTAAVNSSDTPVVVPDWRAETSYVAGGLVSKDGVTWRSSRSHSSSTEFARDVETNWFPLADPARWDKIQVERIVSVYNATPVYEQTWPITFNASLGSNTISHGVSNVDMSEDAFTDAFGFVLSTDATAARYRGGNSMTVTAGYRVLFRATDIFYQHFNTGMNSKTLYFTVRYQKQ